MESLHVLSIGWAQGNVNLIESILRRVEQRTDIIFSHIVSADIISQMSNDSYYQGRLFKFPEEREIQEATLDIEYLAQLERGSSFTLNSLILMDRVLRHVPYNEALIYCCTVAKSIQKVIEEINPAFILGSWDSVYPGLTSMIAKGAGIPFYTTKFSVIPHKEVAFCEYPYQDREYAIIETDKHVLEKRAEQNLKSWLEKAIVAPVYVSVANRIDILKKIPLYFSALKYQIVTSARVGRNKYMKYSISRNIRQFLRKKSNVILRRDSYFISEAPSSPFFFYGLHMQPESSIDVWAPFYSNQYQVIEAIARSMPITHTLCVKIHISDADNYSNDDLRRISGIPGVKIVSPHVGSRVFLERASIIFSIQGTIGLEGALLGKPVIMFGESAVLSFSSAKKVKSIEDLPSLVQNMLTQKPPTKGEIIRDYAQFLKYYLPASSNDWVEVVKNGLTDEEVENYVRIFLALLEFSSIKNSSYKE